MSLSLSLKSGFLVLVFSLAPLPVFASIDRVAYAESIYKSLQTILPVLIESNSVTDPDTLQFLTKSSEILNVYKPVLIFVDDEEKFVMRPGSSPRLMRSPEERTAPIFVNKTLLNSEGFGLNMIQVMKLFMHELGHKTELGVVSARDHWAQKIEDELSSFYHFSGNRTGQPDEQFIEAFSLPPELIQTPLVLDTYKVQPTLWLYAQQADKVVDLTSPVLEQAAENSILNRNVGTEIIMVLSELANAFSQLMHKSLGPIFQTFANSFAEPGHKPKDEVFGNLPKDIKAMTVMSLRKVTQSPHEIILDATQNYIRSHMRKMNFDITGFPWSTNGESFAIQIKIAKVSSGPKPAISLQLSPEPNFKKIAKVGRIIRENGRLKSLDLTFENASFPYSVDLGLHYNGGSFRLRATERELKNTGTYRANFDFLSRQSQLASYVDRITVDNEEVIFLDRKIDIQETTYTPSHFAPGDLLPESIGIWGKRGGEDELGKNFSHLVPPYLFILSVPGQEQFVINPYNLWIEFEVRMDVDIAQVELFWSLEQMITNISEIPDKAITITEESEAGPIKQRYAGGGTLVERRSVRETILFENDHLKELPSSRPGYKIVRMKSLTPMKHLRNLKDENEAHYVPGVTPISMRLIDKDLRSFDYSFPADPKTTGANGPKFTLNCEDLIKSAGKK